MALVLLSLSGFLVTLPAQSVFAQSNITLNGATACTQINGTWDAATSTCTIANDSGIGYELNSGDTLTVSLGFTLDILNTNASNFETTGIQSHGGIVNDGTIIISNSGSGFGILNYGTIADYGTIVTSDSGSGADGILSFGTMTVASGGAVSISNSGNSASGIYNDGVFTNDGNVTVWTVESTIGFWNTGAVTNDGTMVSNSGYGIANAGGTLTNYGNMIINSDDEFGYGPEGSIVNYGTIVVSNLTVNVGTITDYGTIKVTSSGGIANLGNITVANSGPDTIGIDNLGSIDSENSTYGTFSLVATIKFSNTAGDGIDNQGIFINGGIVTVSNPGGTGFDNEPSGNVANTGTFYVCRGTTSGIIPTSGNPIVVCPAATTTAATSALSTYTTTITERRTTLTSTVTSSGTTTLTSTGVATTTYTSTITAPSTSTTTVTTTHPTTVTTTITGSTYLTTVTERATTITTTVTTQLSATLIVSCAQSEIGVGRTVSCRATLLGTPAATGKVSWSTTGMGKFAPSACRLFVGSCKVNYLADSAGEVSLVASYQGNSRHPAVSGSVYLMVGQKASTTVVTCSPTSASVGGTIRCTAIVSGYHPSGTVTWSWSSPNGAVTFVSGLNTCGLVNGRCSVELTGVVPGHATVQANYLGDQNNTPSSNSRNVKVK